MCLALHHQFQLSFDHADNLLVRMLMLRERRAGVDLDPGVCLAISVNETGAQAREELADRQIGNREVGLPDTLSHLGNLLMAGSRMMTARA